MKVNFKALVMTDEVKNYINDKTGKNEPVRELLVWQEGEKNLQKIKVPSSFKAKKGEVVEFSANVRSYLFESKHGLTFKVEQ